MKLSQLIKAIPLKVKGNKSREIKGIMIHSKRVYPGCLFIAFRGAKLDGHNYIHEAVQNGAHAVMLEKAIPWLPKQVTQLVLPDPRRYVALLSSRFYDAPSKKLQVYAVTGTNGKTSCCWFMQQIAHHVGWSMGRTGTLGCDTTRQLYDSNLTTPDSVELQRILAEAAQNGADAMSIEASSQGLHQQRLDHVDLDGALFTNLSQDHLDYHATMQAYAKAKARLFELLGESSKKERHAIIHADDPYSDVMQRACAMKPFTFGIKEGDLRLEAIEHHQGKLEFDLLYEEKRHRVKTQLVGAHNALNIAASIAPFLLKGVKMEELIEACRSLCAPLGRLQRIHSAKNVHLFIDYAHTPEALRQTLQTLKSAFGSRIIVVFGCGGDRDQEKRPLMGSIAAQEADCVIITSDNPRHECPNKIIDDIYRGVKDVNKVQRICERKEAIAKALTVAKRGDLILIAGKGHETYQVIGDLKTRFNDAEVCEQLLHSVAAV